VYPYRSDLTNAPFFSRLYYGNSNSSYPDEMSYCDDYYVSLSSRRDLWEIHIFRVMSTYNIHAVSNMLQGRRDRLQHECASGFYDEATLERVNAAVIFTVEKYVVLCITDNNDLIEEKLRNLL